MLGNVDELKTSVRSESFKLCDMIIVEKQLLQFLQSFKTLNARQLIAFELEYFESFEVLQITHF